MRNKLCLVLYASFFLLTVLSCTTHEAKIMKSGATLLSQKDLESFLSKKVTVDFTISSGTGTTVYNPDGSSTVSHTGGSDSGTYTIKNGMVCSKWKTLRAGSERCYKWYKISEKEYHIVDPDGSFVAKAYLK